jgi:trichothecene 3-O-acetyltransferase
MDDHLDIFGQQPFFTMNTQIYFAFPLTEGSSHGAIVTALGDGLERLYAGFPWLACQVVNEGSCESNSGVYKFKPLAIAPCITVKDLTGDASKPTMDALKQANFPMRMLDENDIAPRKTFAPSPAPSAPAFLIQATFLTGGLIVTFLAQHNTMDMIGQAQIIQFFAKACRGEEFTTDELVSGNLPRHNIVPLLGSSYTPGPEVDRHIVGPAEVHRDTKPSPHPRPDSIWAYFAFSRTSLESLKSLASEAVRLPAFISTDDALSAFLWQSIGRARLSRLNPSTTSTIARAVNARPYLKISPTYPGPIQSSAYTTYTLQTLVDEHLGTIASQLRGTIDPEKSDFEYQTRAIATFLSRTQNKASFSSTANFDHSVDLILSSWAKVRCYDLDFDMGLGKPVAVRRPRFQGVEGLVFLMPMALDGDIAVAISLRVEDMECLRADAEFGKYAKYIG